MSMLADYNKKRHFRRTPEPAGTSRKRKTSKKLSFVIQKHDASTLHYDFRLELDGVLKSWAVPKGPSMNQADKRLAVQVEDHPLSYGKFEGVIPKGNYGAGTVEIWDKGTYEPVKSEGDQQDTVRTQLEKGSLKFILHGERLNGIFSIVKFKGGKNWLLIKGKDDETVVESEPRAKAKSDSAKSRISKPRPKSPRQASKPATQLPGEPATHPKPSRILKDGAKSSNALVTVAGHTLKLTNLDKVFWPEENITKGDLINYYRSMHKYVLPYLKDRPESLKRNPNGIRDYGFFHKDAGQDAPAWVKSKKIYSESSRKDVDYIICNDQATLAYLNNLGCIEINPWNSRLPRLDYPDYLIMDLDPSDTSDFDHVVESALAIKDILDGAGVSSYCKTSGASGLHVYVPMGAEYTYDQIKLFAELIAQRTNKLLPSTTTLERSLAKRKGRIYLDHLQNRKGQTLSCAYSVRPVPGAGVSTPLEWKEVKPGLKPRNFNIFNTLKRVEKKGDLFSPVLKGKTNLKTALKTLE
jgi:DNA ligase D-like protein (predicted polymerase)/DNA ligase D-like protein (predicted 3'-phosphoesterase)